MQPPPRVGADPTGEPCRSLWSISDGKPVRLEARRDFLEVDLESWIERHPRPGDERLEVGRSEDRAPGPQPDRLVGVSREGALVIAELKRGHLGVHRPGATSEIGPDFSNILAVLGREVARW
jgi:hypothetical protein